MTGSAALKATKYSIYTDGMTHIICKTNGSNLYVFDIIMMEGTSNGIFGRVEELVLPNVCHRLKTQKLPTQYRDSDETKRLDLLP